MKVVFFGTPLFAAHVLEYLIDHQVEIAAIISKPDKPKGRVGHPIPTPVKEVAMARVPHLPIYQPEIVSDPSFSKILEEYGADLFVVVAYGEIIKQHLLDMPKKGCINLHASLLPKYRGAAPIQRSIMGGEKETGVTIMHMVKKMDAGDMIHKVSVAIPDEATFGEIEENLCNVGKQALLEVIQAFENGTPSSIAQDATLATFAPKIELEDCQIFWDRPAQELHDLIRGVNPYPGAWCYVKIKGERKRLKISLSRITDQKGASGTLLNREEKKGNLLIATGDKALELLEIQLEGKKKMSSEELTRGLSRFDIEFY